MHRWLLYDCMPIHFCFCCYQLKNSNHNLKQKVPILVIWNFVHTCTHTHVHVHAHNPNHAHPQYTWWIVEHLSPPMSVWITAPHWKGPSYNSVVLKDFFQVMHTQPSVIPMDHGFQILPATCVLLLPLVKCMIRNNVVCSLSHPYSLRSTICEAESKHSSQCNHNFISYFVCFEFDTVLLHRKHLWLGWSQTQSHGQQEQ